MQFYYSEKAASQLYALPVEFQKRIAEKMRYFAKRPDRLLFVQLKDVTKPIDSSVATPRFGGVLLYN